jgi:probable phosphoglycerate mutase
MSLLLLIRHGENDYRRLSRLPGQLPGIHLNEVGRAQARQLAWTLSETPLKAIYSSPLERALETAEPIARLHNLNVQPLPALADVNVGDWAGRSWKQLQRTRLWKQILHQPSAVRFPNGESFAEVQQRVVQALTELIHQHGEKEVLAIVFHADPIKLALAHFLGLPLDAFQRLNVDTASISVVWATAEITRILFVNRLPGEQLRWPG